MLSRRVARLMGGRLALMRWNAPRTRLDGDRRALCWLPPGTQVNLALEANYLGLAIPWNAVYCHEVTCFLAMVVGIEQILFRLGGWKGSS